MPLAVWHHFHGACECRAIFKFHKKSSEFNKEAINQPHETKLLNYLCIRQAKSETNLRVKNAGCNQHSLPLGL